MKSIFTTVFISLLFLYQTFAQTASEKQAIRLSAIAEESPLQLTLKWPASTDGTNYYLYRRALGEDKWPNPIATLDIADTQYIDKTITEGEAYEYKITRIGGMYIKGFGYIYGGVNKKPINTRGGVILCVDSNYIEPLANEINILVEDLIADGWQVYRMGARRDEIDKNVKARIKKIYDNNDGIIALFLLGNIPIPYSGNFDIPPDGHVVGSGSHTDAWPADVFYGDLTDDWTDNIVNVQTAKKQSAWNIPGDGKYDQTYIPTKVELQVGRVDLTNLPLFSESDTLLTKQYLEKNHLFRIGEIAYSRRGLVDDNFTNLNLASTGWDNMIAMFGPYKVSSKDYITSLNKESYLWSYGCGAGSYTSCSGLRGSASANSIDFDTNNIYGVFTMLAGSYFGDWDYPNSFLRAPLASKPSVLACFWGGIPKWHVFHMAMGTHIGMGLQITQENTDYNSGYFHGAFNYSEGKVHIALMGDPTLRMHTFAPPSNLTADSIWGGKIELSWDASPAEDKTGFLGYNIYSAPSKFGKYDLVNDDIITATTFIDDKARNGKSVYVVKAVMLETTGSGTYYNLSNGSMDSASAYWPISVEDLIQESDIQVYPNPNNGVFSLYIENYSRINLDLSITDMLGKTVFEDHIYDYQGSYDKKIDLSQEASNIYILHVKTENQTISKKIFVRK